jgi:hypothetical protein
MKSDFLRELPTVQSSTLINEKKVFGVTVVPRVGISGSTSGKVGLQSDFTINSGTINAKLPFDLSLDLPAQAKPGETVTIKSSFKLDPTANFSTISPNIKYDLDLIYALQARADFQVGGSNSNLLNINVPEKRKDLVNIDAGSVIPKVNIPGGFGSFGLKVPNLNTTGKPLADGKTLSGTKTDSFLNANLDLDKIATTVLRATGVPVPDLSGSVSANLGLFGGKLSYTLADLQLVGNLNLRQKFDLITNSLKGKISLNNAAKTVLDFTVGKDLTFTVPSDIIAGKLNLSAAVNLDASLKNDTSLGGAVSLDFEALKASISGKILGISLDLASFSPLYDKSFPIASGTIANIYDKSFTLGGFNQQTFNAGTINVI